MPKALDTLGANSAYAFLAVGVVWLGLAAVAGSYLILWPAVACIASGALLKLRPGRRFTWAWAVSSAALGFLLSAYRVYAWAPFLGGAFSNLAGASLAGFAVLAVVHVFLLYAGAKWPKAVRSGQS